MTLPIRLSPLARDDLREARRWYNSRTRSLGSRFTRAVDLCLERIQQFPEAAPVVHPSVRRALVQTFPYAVFYTFDEREIVVLAVLHSRRSLEAWQSRLLH